MPDVGANQRRMREEVPGRQTRDGRAEWSPGRIFLSVSCNGFGKTRIEVGALVSSVFLKPNVSGCDLECLLWNRQQRRRHTA